MTNTRWQKYCNYEKTAHRTMKLDSLRCDVMHHPSFYGHFEVWLRKIFFKYFEFILHNKMKTLFLGNLFDLLKIIDILQEDIYKRLIWTPKTNVAINNSFSWALNPKQLNAKYSSLTVAYSSLYTIIMR